MSNIQPKPRPERAYFKYWLMLRDAPISQKYAAKVITLRVPESRVNTTIRMIAKEKDEDFIFKNENYFNPWRMHSKVIMIEPGNMTGHGIAILRLTLDRKTDV